MYAFLKYKNNKLNSVYGNILNNYNLNNEKYSNTFLLEIDKNSTESMNGKNMVTNIGGYGEEYGEGIYNEYEDYNGEGDYGIDNLFYKFKIKYYNYSDVLFLVLYYIWIVLMRE